MNDDRIYKNVIDSISNIINNGIDYYSDKDEEKTRKLRDILAYINSDTTPVENVIEESKLYEIDEEKKEKFTYNSEIDKILDVFMKKITDIKISILNLENDLSLYYNKDISEDTKIENNEELVLDDVLDTEEEVSMDSYDEVNISIEDVLSDTAAPEIQSPIIQPIEDISFNNQENNSDIDVSEYNNEIESLEEDLSNESIDTRKKSILDIFKKK